MPASLRLSFASLAPFRGDNGTIAWLPAAVAAVCLGLAGTPVVGQAKSSSSPGTGPSTAPTAEATPSGAAPATTSRSATASKPLWRDLSARQQKALAPLAPHWNQLTEQHKRKWLALSRNYDELSPADQAVLHSRMTEWAGLSVQERAQARHNFAEVKRVPVDERKAKWEAYQALSDQKKKELAARSNMRPPGATATIQPVPAAKLTTVPPPVDGHLPRIQLAPAGGTVPAGTPASRGNSVPSSLPSVPAEAQVPSPVGNRAGQAESQPPAAPAAASAVSPAPTLP